MRNSCQVKGRHHRDSNSGSPVYYTVPPVSRHWSCQSEELNLRAWISGDVQVGTRLRPVNSMHLARKKGSPRCVLKLLFIEFIKSVSNFLLKSSSRNLSPLKITILLNFLAFLGVPDNFPEVILDFYRCQPLP